MSKTSKILAIALALLMAVTGIGVSSISAEAAAESTSSQEEGAGKGKYVADVYFAYGSTEEEAVDWLKKNGWEPIKGSNDFNAGKASFYDKNMAIAMGIKRTDKADEAITDMAVVNMKGGYSLPDYENLLKQKKTQIDEFVNGFIPVLKEYRANYNGEGSSYGKKCAELAHDMLNQFYDGGTSEEYPKNDTGLELGDLLLMETRQEGNPAGGDLQQIILEGNSSVVLLMEQMLTFAADTGKETWVKRLEGLSGDQLIENLEDYVPEAKGQNVSASVAMQYLNERFGDTAKIFQDQWNDIHEDMVWYESYNTENKLWMEDGESSEKYQERAAAYFKDMEKKDPDTYDEVFDDYAEMDIVYNMLYNIPYAGEWGDTLGDFFNPGNDAAYAQNADTFLPFAAALSEGQRAAASMVSFRSLLIIGSGGEKGLDLVKPELDESFKNSGEPESLYFGINRAIFRGGVALTSAAEMAQNMGYGQAYRDLLYYYEGVAAVASVCAAAVGVLTLITGSFMISEGYKRGTSFLQWEPNSQPYKVMEKAKEKMLSARTVYSNTKTEATKKAFEKAQRKYEDTCYLKETTGVGYAGRVLVAIGAVLLIGVACYNGYQLYSYYQKTFTPIPLMIVDEADIVSYTKDQDGNEVKNINFDQYAYMQPAGSRRAFRLAVRRGQICRMGLRGRGRLKRRLWQGMDGTLHH